MSIFEKNKMKKALYFAFAAISLCGCGNNFTEAVHVPSNNPMSTDKMVREMMEITVPENGNVFTDNVLSLRNMSHNDEIYGNAAIAFMDPEFIERGAIGYSRNQAIQPGGYYPNTLYIEIGNAFTNDDQDTDFKVIRTLKDGDPCLSFIPIEVLCNGQMNLRTDNGKHVNVEGGLVVDKLYLSSPGGNLFTITIDDNGNLSTSKVK